jgi:hypothetical protein
MIDEISRYNRDNMHSLHNVTEIFSYIFAWTHQDNHEHFKRVISMLDKNEIWEVMLALETFSNWISDVWDKKEKSND